VSTQGVARQSTHVGKHLGRPQAVHSDFALGSSELECGGGCGRGGVDHLDEVELELAAVLESTADEVGVGRSRAGVQAGASEVEDGRDTVGLDGFTTEVLGTLEICKGSFRIESMRQNGDHSRSTWTMAPRIQRNLRVVPKTWPSPGSVRLT
jgi:hypothetical protein